MRAGSGLWLPVVAILLASCAGDPALESRYSAERDVWRATREFSRLSIKPELVEDASWRALAESFKDIGERYATPSHHFDGVEEPRAASQTRVLGAHALSRSGDIFLGIGDTTAALAAYEAIAVKLADLPVAAAGGILAGARVDEARGSIDRALRAYQSILDSVTPNAGMPGVQSAVLQLPLRMARLRAARGTEDRDAAYAEARAYYTEHMGGSARNTFEARSRLIDIATDLKDWDSAIGEMRKLEEEMRGLDDPPEDPARIRLGIAEAQRLGLGDKEAGAATLRDLVEDYPGSPATARALLALGKVDGGDGELTGAFASLDRLDTDFSGETELRADGVFYRARLLEQADRWPEALELYRSLPLDFPFTEPALSAPLEIAAHHERGSDPAALSQALEEAEQTYREFIHRFPDESFSLSAREKLVRVLLARNNHAEAIDELLILAGETRGSAMGAAYLLSAAQLTETELSDTGRSTELYGQVVAWYPESQFSTRAQREIARLTDGGGAGSR